MRNIRSFCAALFTAFGLVAVSDLSALAQGYPSRPIRWVVPYPPGGSTDAIARPLAQKMSELLEVAIVVDNRSGAGGTLGINAVAKAPADGYTLLVSDGSLATASSLYSKLPFSVEKDLEPIVLFVSIPHIVLLHPGVPADTLRDFIALAKKSDAINFGSGGIGSPLHLAGELFRVTAGLEWTHVPYKGAGPAITALIAGEVQVALPSVPAVLGYVKGGRVKPLAVTSGKRSALLPDVPTVSEAGLPGAETAGWVGLHVPAGTSPQIVSRLHAAARQVLDAPDVRARLAGQGAEIIGGTADEYRQFLDVETSKWSRIIQKAGITPD